VTLASIDEGSLIVSALKALHKLGYFPIGLAETAKAITLTAILFVGPLFEAGIAEGQWRDWIRLRGLDAVVHGWIGYRNMVAVRPSLPLTHPIGDPPDKLHTLGTDHRRNSLPLGIGASSPGSPDLKHHHHLPDTHHLRPRAHPPLLRVPHHPPSHPHCDSSPTLPATTGLHHLVRRLRHIPLPTNREFGERDPRPLVLQLDGLPAILGTSHCRNDDGT